MWKYFFCDLNVHGSRNILSGSNFPCKWLYLHIAYKIHIHFDFQHIFYKYIRIYIFLVFVVETKGWRVHLDRIGNFFCDGTFDNTFYCLLSRNFTVIKTMLSWICFLFIQAYLYDMFHLMIILYYKHYFIAQRWSLDTRKTFSNIVIVTFFNILYSLGIVFQPLLTWFFAWFNNEVVNVKKAFIFHPNPVVPFVEWGFALTIFYISK